MASRIANIVSKWVSGSLVFYDRATATEIFKLNDGATGGPSIAQGQTIVGSRFSVNSGSVVAATTNKTFWIAPAPCKLIEAKFSSDVAASTASYLNVEKLINTLGITAGVTLQANSFPLINTANYVLTDTPAVTGTQYAMTTGDRLALKFDTSQITLLAGGVVSLTMEWT